MEFWRCCRYIKNKHGEIEIHEGQLFIVYHWENLPYCSDNVDFLAMHFEKVSKEEFLI